MKKKTTIKRITDAALVAVLLLLMSFQVTKQFAHEWLGIAMFALALLHNILNRKYYAAIFRGRYTPLRVIRLAVNLLLVGAILCTALSGMMMSRYATPFLSGTVSAMLARQVHSALSRWSFVLMGVHLGMHLGIVAAKLTNKAARWIAAAAMCGVAVYGFFLFIRADVFGYMFFKAGFTFFDYSKPWWQVILENLLMLLAWTALGYLITLLSGTLRHKNKQVSHNT